MIENNASRYDKLFREEGANLKKYLGEWVNPKAVDGVIKDFSENAWLGLVVVHDWINNRKDPNINIVKFIQHFMKSEVFVTMVLGMPGQGKTATTYAICDILRKLPGVKRICWVSPTRLDALPDWIVWVSRPTQLGEGDIGVVDEASLRDNARNAMQNTDDLMWLAIGRQRGCKIIYISQLSSISDLNIMRFVNIIISKSYDTSAIGIGEAERKMISENPVLKYMYPADNYARIPSTKKDWSVVSIGSDYMMCYIPKPPWFTDKHSKPFRRYIDAADGDGKKAEEMAFDEARQMRDAGYSGSKIFQELSAKGYDNKGKRFWREFTGEIKSKGENEFT